MGTRNLNTFIDNYNLGYNEYEMKKILVLGASGMLGHKVFEVLSKYREYFVFDAPNVDAKKIETFKKVIEKVRPEVVINCIGIKDNSPEIFLVNSQFPNLVAEICRENKIRLITISTDGVFDGKKGNYKESEVPNCKDIYGISKCLGEINDGRALTIRTSLIGHELKTNVGLLDWFLDLRTNSVLGYKNAVFSGITTLELAEVLARKIIPNEKISGIYHFSGKPISKYELLKIIADVYDKKIKIKPDIKTKINRSLNSTKLRGIIDYNLPNWSDLIQKMHENFLNSKLYEEKREKYKKENHF